jgi:uncharacterized protein
MHSKLGKQGLFNGESLFLPSGRTCRAIQPEGNRLYISFCRMVYGQIMKHRLNYVELPVRNLPTVSEFYTAAFGWDLTSFGSGYAATTTDDVDLGLNGATDEQAIAAPLAIIESDNLEASEQAVIAAGGNIIVPIFGFPGGRRFHFADPDGNQLGVWQKS